MILEKNNNRNTELGIEQLFLLFRYLHNYQTAFTQRTDQLKCASFKDNVWRHRIAYIHINLKLVFIIEAAWTSKLKLRVFLKSDLRNSFVKRQKRGRFMKQRNWSTRKVTRTILNPRDGLLIKSLNC